MVAVAGAGLLTGRRRLLLPRHQELQQLQQQLQQQLLLLASQEAVAVAMAVALLCDRDRSAVLVLAPAVGTRRQQMTMAVVRPPPPPPPLTIIGVRLTWIQMSSCWVPKHQCRTGLLVKARAEAPPPPLVARPAVMGLLRQQQGHQQLDRRRGGVMVALVVAAAVRLGGIDGLPLLQQEALAARLIGNFRPQRERGRSLVAAAGQRQGQIRQQPGRRDEMISATKYPVLCCAVRLLEEGREAQSDRQVYS
eukprot:COSAG06_NODE_12800_length_1327_cov_1.083062_1_plen_249_part_10